MKPGRNDPCICGSDKKYRKCCYLLAEKNNNNKDVLSDDDTQEDIIKRKEYEHMFKDLIRIRQIMLNKKPHMKKYYKTRKMHTNIISAMAHYYNSGEFTPKIDNNDTSRRIKNSPIALIESDFDLTTREGEQAFYDMLLYKHAPNMNCITEEFIQKNHYKNNRVKTEFLHSMMDSKLGLFEITGTDFSEGYAYIRDVFTGEEYAIIDVGLSMSQDDFCDDFYMYTRIITYGDISFGSGLSFVFSKKDKFIQKHIQHYKKKFSADVEYIRFMKLYNYYSKMSDKGNVIANSIE